MQVKRERRKPFSVASGTRKNSCSGKPIEPTFAGRRKGGKSITSFLGSRFYSLNKDFVTKHAIEVSLLQNDCDILGSERMQFEAAEKLYSVLKNNPSFIDNVWRGDEGIFEILTFLFTTINKLVDYQWCFKEDLTVLIPYDINIFFHGVPMYHLPELKEANIQAFDLTIDLLSLLNSNVELPLWNSHYEQCSEEYFESLIEEFEEDEKEGNENHYPEYIEDVKNDLLDFQSVAASLLNQIQKNMVSVSELEGKVSSFSPSNDWENRLRDWVKEGLTLLNQENTLSDFVFYDEENENSKLIPFDYYRFIWKDAGVFYNEWFEGINCVYENNEVIAPCCFYKITSDPNSWNLSLPLWPALLSKFLINGIHLMEDFKVL